MDEAENILFRPPIPPPRKRGRPRKEHKTTRKDITNSPAQAVSKDRMLEEKLKMLTLIENGTVATLSAAARKAGVTPIRARRWAHDDKDFGKAVEMAQEVFADSQIEELGKSTNVIAKIFLIKGIYPKYRDNYHAEERNQKLEGLLEELKRIGQKSVPALPAPTTVSVETTSVTLPDFLKPVEDKPIELNEVPTIQS